MDGFGLVFSVLILAGTILLITFRPAGIGEGLAASAGAALMVGAGWASLTDVWQTVETTSSILLFLMGMMVIATVADHAGVFDWAAGHAVRASRGRGRLLYVYFYLLGVIVTLFLSLDVTAIIFTPIVCAAAVRLRINPIPFVFASAFVANTASLALPVSNLTNMLVFDLLDVGFWSFVRHLALPNLAAVAVNLAVFLILFRSDIPTRFGSFHQSEAVRDRRFLALAGFGLAIIVFALLAAGFLGWPLHVVALIGAGAMAGTGVASGRVSKATLRKGIAWQLPLFVVGMYVVVLGVNRAVLAPFWGALLGSVASEPLVGLPVLAFATGLGANVVNNIPMSLVAINALSSASDLRDQLAFATIIGTNLGPNVTVFGSLATMLVLTAARQRGIVITSGQYLRVGLLTTPPMIAAATVVLLATFR
jgi:arsenical pump membrane protein